MGTNVVPTDVVTIDGVSSGIVVGTNSIAVEASGADAYFSRIYINGTLTYSVGRSIGNTMYSFNALFGDASFNGSAKAFYPALADGTDDVLGLGIRNPPET